MVIDKLKDRILENLGDYESTQHWDVPEELCIIPLKDSVIYPQTISPIKIEKPESIKAIDQAMGRDKVIGVVAFKEGAKKFEPEHLYEYGTAVMIHKMLKIPGQGIVLIVQGLEKIRIKQFVQTEPYWQAIIEPVAEESEKTEALEALMRNALAQVQKLITLVPYLPEELQMAAGQIEEPLKLAYLIASLIRMKVSERQEILELPSAGAKLGKAVAIMNRELELLELGSKIQSEVQGEMDRSKRDYFLRQQLKAIQKELGEGEEDGAELDELKAKLDGAGLSEQAKKEADKELSRLKRMPTASSEYHVIRTYLDWLSEVPWSIETKDNLDLAGARKVLNEDHYGLDKVKDRIIEFLAVRKLKDDMKGSILCLVGPPGVGKTSLGKSIARALGRKFVRQSLGGMHDEAEIRGHRRTYIGAMPGKILQSLKTAGQSNPVLMLDEIDKIGQDFRGDPSSALLEVLDPEQNSTFTDHYLGVPFDLSKVLFIATANSLDTIQRALLDRMEVISLSGYSLEEKIHIARRYLVPKQIEKHGLTVRQIAFSEAALHKITASYTREAGVRNLEREIASVCRKVATQVATGDVKKKVTVTPKLVGEYLGIEKAFNEIASRTSRAGVATGLAWTPAGGDILFIEATKMPGSKGLIITGQLGDVMKESVQAAMSVVRTRAKALGIDPNFRNKYDIHLHVPAGAIPKDGPSAGLAMATALTSLLLDRPINKDVAMTGEITLTGQALPIGGLKEKTLAAKRAGIKTVIVPARNKPDIEEIEPELLEGLNFVFVETIDEVLDVALVGAESVKSVKSIKSVKSKPRHPTGRESVKSVKSVKSKKASSVQLTAGSKRTSKQR